VRSAVRWLENALRRLCRATGHRYARGGWIDARGVHCGACGDVIGGGLRDEGGEHGAWPQ
jgi:hypothetical protein